MRIALFAALVAAMTVATPALAASGPRVGVVAGFANPDFVGTDTFTYGANVGYDLDLGNAVVGVTGEYQDAKNTGRELSVVARLGGKVTANTTVYGLAGYTNLGAEDVNFNVDGYRVGAGVETKLGRNAYVNLEQRYSNYEYGIDGYQTVVGLGLRF